MRSIWLSNFLSSSTHSSSLFKSIARCWQDFSKLLVATAVLWLGLITNATAATFLVNVNNDAVDTNPGDGECVTGVIGCTLRAAIMEANANGNPNEIDTITIAPNIANITLDITDDNGIENGDEETDLNIYQSVEIVSNRLNNTAIADIKDRLTTLDASGIFNQHFNISADVLLRGLRLTGGLATNFEGGAVRLGSNKTLTLDRCVLESNSTTGSRSGGAIYAQAGTTLNIDNTDIIDNSISGGNGAAIYAGGITTINRSSIRGNYTDGKAQIHVGANGTLRIKNSTLSAIGVAGAAPIGIFSQGSPLFIDGLTVVGHTDIGVSAQDGSDLSLSRTAFKDNGTDCSTDDMAMPAVSAYNWFEEIDSDCSVGTANQQGTLDGADLSGLGTDDRLVTYFYNLPSTSSLIEKGGTVEQGCEFTNDQRGAPRPYDGNDYGLVACDAGAVEYNTGLFKSGFEDAAENFF